MGRTASSPAATDIGTYRADAVMQRVLHIRDCSTSFLDYYHHVQLFRPVKQYAECGKHVAQLLVNMGAPLGGVLLNVRKFIVSGNVATTPPDPPVEISLMGVLGETDLLL
jgi:hypothetical protein